MPSRRPNRQLVQLFEQSPRPIYVVDDSRQIAYCNAACAAWFGVEAARIVGQICHYHSGETLPPAGEVAAAMSPPPQAFQGEQATGHVVWRGPEGRVEQRSGVFFPLGGREGDPQGVIVLLSEAREVTAPTAFGSELQSSQELHERLQQLTRHYRRRYRLDRLVGESLAMRRVREQVDLAVAGKPRVVIVGPPGSGRSHVARTIHAGDNPDKAGPLLPLYCPSLDRESLQAAVLDFLRRMQDQSSRQPGTLLLQEVDALAAEAQAELLAFFRVPTFTARTIATARQSLLPPGNAGVLTELAYGLSSLVIELPALRDRPEDIPLLAQRFVEDFNATSSRQLAGFSPAALDRLASLPWTGNVAELAAVVAEACRHVSTVWIGESDLPDRVRAVIAAGSHPRRVVEEIRLDDFLVDVERELIQRAMKKARGNKSKAARLLGVSRPRLLRRLVQLGLEAPPAQEIEFQPIDDEPSSAAGEDVE